MAHYNQHAENDKLDASRATESDDDVQLEVPVPSQDLSTAGSPPAPVASSLGSAAGSFAVARLNRRDRFLKFLLARVTRFLGDSDRMCGLAIAVGLFGFAASFLWSDFACFARSGALIVAIGIALVSRTAITGKDLGPLVVKPTTGLTHLNSEHYRQAGEPMPEWLPGELRAWQAVGFLGPLVSFIGTVIWGFGDLLNAPFGF